MNKQEHWEQVYKSKDTDRVSWYEPTPDTSLSLISSLELSPDSAIIDIGGGNSNLTKELLSRGYTDLTVLDISSHALEQTKDRLGDQGDQVRWIVSDILRFVPQRRYDVWHDRAAFHFLNETQEVEQYLSVASQAIGEGGYLVISMFSTSGPDRCSGLHVRQYDTAMISEFFGNDFRVLQSFEKVHITPKGGEQIFLNNILQKR